MRRKLEECDELYPYVSEDFKLPKVIYANLAAVAVDAGQGCVDSVEVLLRTWGIDRKYKSERELGEPGGLYYAQSIVRKIQAENYILKNNLDAEEGITEELREFTTMLEFQLDECHKAARSAQEHISSQKRMISAMWGKIEAQEKELNEARVAARNRRKEGR